MIVDVVPLVLFFLVLFSAVTKKNQVSTPLFGIGILSDHV